MANKKVERIEIDREELLRILNEKGLSIRKLEKADGFFYTARSISRAFKDGASTHLARDLSEFLNVPIAWFSKSGSK